MAEPSRTIPQRESRNDLSAVLREVESRIDERLAGEFACLVVGSRRAGKHPATTDALIAATTAAYGLTVCTQDVGFRSFRSIDVVVI
ncbi:MAG: hypothetical protein H0V36_03875 [Chloroflexi bacterium]|nr:hypothetical protein [Chloroflexota bacterium]